MAITRENAADYLAGMFAEQLTDAGIGSTDVAGSLKEPIDAALRLTGTAQGDLATATVDDADAIGFFAVLDFTMLTRLQRAIIARVDIQLDGPQMSKARSQAVKNIAAAVESAKKAADPYMITGEWGIGTIALDYLEPVVTT